jgi:hypothetical protein
MPDKPSREQLLAQIAALQGQLAEMPPPFVREQSVTRQAVPPAEHKTYQVPPTPQQFATVRGLMVGMRSSDPVVIQSQIDAITTVIASGVNSAGYGDKRTEFRSLNELRQILDGLLDNLAEALGGRRRSSQVRMTMPADKGL